MRRTWFGSGGGGGGGWVDRDLLNIELALPAQASSDASAMSVNAGPTMQIVDASLYAPSGSDPIATVDGSTLDSSGTQMGEYILQRSGSDLLYFMHAGLYWISYECGVSGAGGEAPGGLINFNFSMGGIHEVEMPWPRHPFQQTMFFVAEYQQSPVTLDNPFEVSMAWSAWHSLGVTEDMFAQVYITRVE